MRILLAGTHRCGSTWVANVLGRTKGIHNVYEPDEPATDILGTLSSDQLGAYPALAPADEVPTVFDGLGPRVRRRMAVASIAGSQARWPADSPRSRTDTPSWSRRSRPGFKGVPIEVCAGAHPRQIGKLRAGARVDRAAISTAGRGPASQSSQPGLELDGAGNRWRRVACR